MDPITHLPKPLNGRPDVLIIAGEHSGDEHAARMVKDLLTTHSWAKVCAFGGPKLEEAGAQLIYNLVDHSVVGLVEVLKRFFFFRSLMKRTIAWITLYRPRVVCFVDYPGFNLRIAEQLYNQRIAKQNGGDVTLLYYISPQIWAWKAKRRFKMAELLDGLAVIFPFEVECYRDTQLPVRFVGHPFMEEDYVMPVRYDKKGAILLLPGSRTQPVSRIFPVMARAWALAAQQLPGDEAIVLYPSEKIKNVLERVLEEIPEAKVRLRLQKIEECTPAKAVLTSSGTMSLICALAGIPGAIAYRTHPLTFEIGRRVVKLKHLGIANILLKEEEAYKEYLQDDATPETLANALLAMVFDQSSRAKAFKNATRLMDVLTEKVESTPARWLADNLGTGFKGKPKVTRPPLGVKASWDIPPPLTRGDSQGGREITLPPITPVQEIPEYKDDAAKPHAPSENAGMKSKVEEQTKTSEVPKAEKSGEAKDKETATTPLSARDSSTENKSDEPKEQAVIPQEPTVKTPAVHEQNKPESERLKQPPHSFIVKVRTPSYTGPIDPLSRIENEFYVARVEPIEGVQPLCHTVAHRTF